MSASAYHQRYALLHQAAHQPLLQSLLYEVYRRDGIRFCTDLLWTLDPREQPVIRPFILHPFQAETWENLTQAAACGNDVLIEKSRDMGVSWLVAAWILHQWLFEPGSQFLMASRKLDYVDHPGDPTSLMEKMRLMLRWLPPWILPKGFRLDKHATRLRLRNPSNGSVVVGESASEHFSRGGRYKAIFMDEFPVWAHDEAAWAAAGQSTPCRIAVGTPYGKNNLFARLRFSQKITVLTLHWQRHPLKDNTWYARQCARMTPDEIARELDINYNLSVANRVFPHFGEIHKASQLKPLPHKRLIRVWDFGYHCPACLVLQVNDDGQVRVLREVVGHQEVLHTFAKRVLELCNQWQHQWKKEWEESLQPSSLKSESLELFWEDVCDPAGAQHNDKSDHTSIEILNQLNVHPFHTRSRIQRGLELIRHKLLVQPHTNAVGLVVDRDCKHLIDAFEGGYRYASEQHELPLEEHPYEDVMDCLRYALCHKCNFTPEHHKYRQRHPSSKAYPHNRYTGY